jgi:hypothetical protein
MLQYNVTYLYMCGIHSPSRATAGPSVSNEHRHCSKSPLSSPSLFTATETHTVQLRTSCDVLRTVRCARYATYLYAVLCGAVTFVATCQPPNQSTVPFPSFPTLSICSDPSGHAMPCPSHAAMPSSKLAPKQTSSAVQVSRTWGWGGVITD